MPQTPFELPGLVDGSVLLVPGDLHFGACDVPVFYLMLRAAQDAKVSHVVLQGDTFECGGLSDYPKSAKSLVTGELLVEREMLEGKVPLRDLARLSTVKHAYAMPGNHEDRVARIVQERPALLGSISWEGLYGEALEDYAVIDPGEFVKAGPLCIFHGHTLTGIGRSKTPAKVIADNYPTQNTMFGHTHRRDSYTRPTWKNGKKEMHGAWNVGHCAIEGHPSLAYAGDQPWEQSFALVYFFRNSDAELVFHVDLARVLRDSKNRPTVLVGGKAYR